MAAVLDGGFADPPIAAASAFRAALDAMSRPGTIQQVAGATAPDPLSDAAGILALTLCDPETGLWLAPSVDTGPVRDWLTFHAGVPFVPRDRADFAIGRWEEMVPLSDFPAGTPAYPDRSATLIVECEDLGSTHVLTGPGIAGEARLSVPDPNAFRANNALFPLGLDFYLTVGDRIAGLPRTTRVGG